MSWLRTQGYPEPDTPATRVHPVCVRGTGTTSAGPGLPGALGSTRAWGDLTAGSRPSRNPGTAPNHKGRRRTQKSVRFLVRPTTHAGGSRVYQ